MEIYIAEGKKLDNFGLPVAGNNSEENQHSYQDIYYSNIKEDENARTYVEQSQQRASTQAGTRIKAGEKGDGSVFRRRGCILTGLGR